MTNDSPASRTVPPGHRRLGLGFAYVEKIVPSASSAGVGFGVASFAGVQDGAILIVASSEIRHRRLAKGPLTTEAVLGGRPLKSGLSWTPVPTARHDPQRGWRHDG